VIAATLMAWRLMRRSSRRLRGTAEQRPEHKESDQFGTTRPRPDRIAA
jgi:hypothetical protein